MAAPTTAPAPSLDSFDELDPAAAITSPRSLKALKLEGVLPTDVLYKRIEDFKERNLSPRLAKLRYDFFEAKRRDLLAAARRARDHILSEERREAALRGQALEVASKESGVSQGALLALTSDGLRAERAKMARAQERERSWLKGALDTELKQLKLLESASAIAEEGENTQALRQQAAAQRMKEIADKKADTEERKQLERDARLRLEKEIAKEEFQRLSEERQRQATVEARRQKELHSRQVEEVERKKQVEAEKQEKKEAAFREQEARKAEMRAQDLRRTDVLNQHKQVFQEQVERKKASRVGRALRTSEANLEVERQRREEFEEKQFKDVERQERLDALRELEFEENSKKAMQSMMRQKMIFEESRRKQDDRRNVILDLQEENEFRLLEHEQKKERYLDFKRELDSLRTKNKEINVERQRRRQTAARERVAEQVRRKDDKIDALNHERKKIWQMRKDEVTSAVRVRETVRAEIMKQRIQSKYNSGLLEKKMRDLSITKSRHTASAPDLRSSGRVGTMLAMSADEVDAAYAA